MSDTEYAEAATVEVEPGPRDAGARLRLGVSSCLLGRKVRFDGQHKRDDFLCDLLGPMVEWVAVCPEVEVGLGTPRETSRLVQTAAGVRLVMPKSGRDLTDEMTAFAARRVRRLDEYDLDGYVLKKDSPTCGLHRVRRYAGPEPGAWADRDGVGLYAQALRERFPNLPLEEEGRLHDARLRDNFVERAFAYRRLRRLFTGRWSVGALVAFHTAHKLLLLAHSPDGYRRLGRRVAGAKGTPRDELRAQYEAQFMATLGVLATPGRHANVLQHMLGYLKDRIDAASRDELLTAIDDYRRGLLPLIVPVTLLRHHLRQHRVAYLLDQVYLEPHPKELMLRNHV
jgi:uncharacterized protein YbgA (DUF1722 family)/uncharacterized protein YbbK (DUF523 family)